MAEEADKNSTPKEAKKRRLRVNSETVRERTEKLQLEASTPAKPKRRTAFASGLSWPLRQIGKVFAPLGRFRAVRVVGNILLPRYFRNSWKELRLVTWPDRRTSLKLTWAVIIFSLIFGVVLAVVDFTLDKLFKEFIIK